MSDARSGGHRVRLRDSVTVLSESSSRVQFRSTFEQTVTAFDVEPWVHAVLPLMDGTSTSAELADAVAGVSRSDIDDLVDVLVSERLVTTHLLSTDTSGRHSRQLRLFDEVIAAGGGLEGLDASAVQDRLNSSSVLVVGVGGAGSWVVQALAHTGVGRLVLCDPDRVELSNLGRQVMFVADDVGRPKVEAAAERIRQIDDTIAVDHVIRHVSCSSDLDDLCEGVDLVVACADSPSVAEVADLVAEACAPRGIAHIVGGAYGSMLGAPGISVLPGRTTCWPCVRAATIDDHGGSEMTVLKGTRAGGTTASIAGAVGNLTALEAVRLLTGMRPALAGGIREIDLATYESSWRSVERQPTCPCSP
jgi:molybdopterin/thiamine biosynthesis adenylyltransferase